MLNVKTLISNNSFLYLAPPFCQIHWLDIHVEILFIVFVAFIDIYNLEYKPSSAGGTRSPPATPHRLQNPKWLPVSPKMADGFGKVVTPRFLGILSNFR